MHYVNLNISAEYGGNVPFTLLPSRGTAFGKCTEYSSALRLTTQTTRSFSNSLRIMSTSGEAAENSASPHRSALLELRMCPSSA